MEEISFKDFVLGSINGTIEIGTKIEQVVDNYKWEIHGNYYRRVYELRRDGIFYNVYNVNGRNSNYGWWSFSLPIDNSLYKIK